MDKLQNPKNMLELYGTRKHILDVGGQDELFITQQKLIKSGSARNSAIAAWLDLMPEHEMPYSNSSEKWQEVFHALYPKGANIPIRPSESDRYKRLTIIENSLAFQFPSIFQDLDTKKSYAHLIQILEESGTMGDYEDITEYLFRPYMIIDGGAETNLAFNKHEIYNRHLEEDDLYDSQVYAIIRAVKEGKDVHIQWMEDGQVIQKSTKEMIALSKRIAEGGGSMWTGLQHPSRAENEHDQKGMEVVIVSGDQSERTSRQVVGRWVYTKTIKGPPGTPDEKRIVPLQYNLEESIRVLSAYKRGNFMDIDNNEDIYDNVERWYKEKAGFLDSIPSMTEEIVTKAWLPFNIGKFEYNEVVKPFWEKYGPQGQNLSKEAFADKWEEVRLQETFAFEQKFYDFYPMLKNILTPFRANIGPVRYGTPRGSRGISVKERAQRRENMDMGRKYLLDDRPDLGEGLGAQIKRNWDAAVN